MAKKFFIMPGGRIKKRLHKHVAGERGSHRYSVFDRYDRGKAYDRAGKLRLRLLAEKVEMADAVASLFD